METNNKNVCVSLPSCTYLSVLQRNPNPFAEHNHHFFTSIHDIRNNNNPIIKQTKMNPIKAAHETFKYLNNPELSRTQNYGSSRTSEFSRASYHSSVSLSSGVENMNAQERYALKNMKNCEVCNKKIHRDAKTCLIHRPLSIGKENNPNWRGKAALRGQLNGSWKGDKVGYSALHTYIKKYKHKPKLCAICNETPPHDLANISGQYKRDLNDFAWLCKKCHYHFDNKTIPIRDELGRFTKKVI